MLSGENNVITVEGVPVFYWPFFATDLQRPPLYINSIAYRNDQVFGNQVLVDLNPYEILGIRHPPQGHQLDRQPRLSEPARLRRRHEVRLRPHRIL